MWKFLSASLVAVAAFCAPAHADLFRPLDRGGRLGDYLERIVAASGQRHEIRGDCMSACTLWLGHRGACVAPDAVLWFHAARDPGRALLQENPWRAMSAHGNQTLLSFYPPRVRAVVKQWLQSPDYHTLSGAQLIALGVPAC